MYPRSGFVFLNWSLIQLGVVFFFLAQYLRFFEMREKRGGWRGPCSLCCLLYSICVSLLIHGQLALRSINFTLKTAALSQIQPLLLMPCWCLFMSWFSHSLPLWDSPLPSPPPARLVIYLFIPEVEADRGRVMAGRRKGGYSGLMQSDNTDNRGVVSSTAVPAGQQQLRAWRERGDPANYRPQVIPTRA